MKKNSTTLEVSSINNLDTKGQRVALFARDLLRWYRSFGRDLPWRNDANPYAVWLSEVMLQQTQVATVIPYYRRFLSIFPTMTALAAAPLSEVLRVWEGLGYYARARNLHRAAQEMVARFGGQVPSTFDDLHALPGIGRSTAGAILTIAFGQRHPILDGNVRRVLCRYFCVAENPRDREVQSRLWQYAEELLPQKEADLYTHALMDLGATLCLPKSPQCPRCPVRAGCLGYQRGIQSDLPKRGATQTLPHRDYAAGAIVCGDRVLIRRRPEQGLLGGLWELPGGRVDTPQPGFSVQLRAMLRPYLRGRIGNFRAWFSLEQTFTHFKMTLHLFIGRVANLPDRSDKSDGADGAEGADRAHRIDSEYRWAPLSGLSAYPFSSAHRKVITRLNAQIAD